jgi:hypothetical protein
MKILALGLLVTCISSTGFCLSSKDLVNILKIPKVETALEGQSMTYTHVLVDSDTKYEVLFCGEGLTDTKDRVFYATKVTGTKGIQGSEEATQVMAKEFPAECYSVAIVKN